jgi:hypothetical protein
VLNTWLHTTAPHEGYVYNAPGYFELLDVVIPPPSAPNGSDATTNVKVNTDLLNVRDKPSLSGSVVAQYERGKIVQVYSQHNVRADGHNWYQLYSTLPRWIAGDLTVNVDGPQPSPAPTPVPTPYPPGGNWSTGLDPTWIGGHGNPGGWSPNAAELDVYRRNGVKLALIPCYQAGQSGAIAYLKGAGVLRFILRAAISGYTDAASFAAETLPIIREYVAALGGSNNVMIQIGNEPNLVAEGWTKTWQSGSDFAIWWLNVASVFRANLPLCKLGFAPMSPGGNRAGIGMDEWQFIAGCGAAITGADWIAVHNYWQASDAVDLTIPPTWRQHFGSKPVVVTETGPAGATLVTAQAIQHAHSLYAAAGLPATFWIVDGSGFFNNADWKLNNITLNPNPPSAPAPQPTPPTGQTGTFKGGIHIEGTNISDPERQKLLDFCTRLHTAGHTLEGVVVVDDVKLFNDLAGIVKRRLFRSWPNGQKFDPSKCDTPEHAAAHADEIYDAHWPIISQLVGSNIYVQFRNEKSEFPYDTYFELQIAKRCDKDGKFKAGMFADSLGAPEIAQWQTREAALEYAMQNGHLAVIHDYGAEINDQPANVPMSDPATWPWYAGRFILLEDSVPDNCRPDFFFGEAGTSDALPHGQVTIDDVDRVNTLLQAYKEALVFCLYGFGNSKYNMDSLLAQFEVLAMAR